MKTVILCGGKGTRMGEGKPKALVEIGNKPIIWHIMKIYAHFGFRDFLLCLGYKGDDIKKYVDKLSKSKGDEKKWNITCVDTGLNTNTGGRIKKIEKYIDNNTFFATYGDGLANIDLSALLKFHTNHKKIATLTVVKPYSQFGILKIGKDGKVIEFKEKPRLNQWINGGFFVFSKKVFDYLKNKDILERDSFGRLIKAGQLIAFKFQGQWMCMDTFKDNLMMNELWKGNKAFWKR